MAKLPRRTMSMAKRATKLAEDAADVDLIEALTGNGEPDSVPAPDSAPARERVGAFAYMGAWALSVAGVLVILFALFLVCSAAETGVPDFSPTGALPHEAASYRVGDPEDGRMGRDASPFPDADTVAPTILEVSCPEGTVHIATGANAADSVCVKGELADPHSASVGGTGVPPSLDCEEDEVIGFTGIDTLGCVYLDTLAGQGSGSGTGSGEPTPAVPLRLPDTGAR